MEEKESKELPKLVKGSAVYKLTVPESVESKIRYLLHKFPSTEWSGVLFITHEGSFEEGNLSVTCRDIYPMDLGDATFTTFNMSEDVAAYMADNLELFDCDLALIHSHHYMSTNPSGTDLETLRKEGNERNCFVSLIVNNAGTYFAAITRKVQTKSEVTVKRLGKSYEFFGEGEVSLDNNNEESTQIIDTQTVEYYVMEVEREVTENSFEYLDKRFDEIKKKKEEEKTPAYTWPKYNTGYSSYNWYDWDDSPKYEPKSENKQESEREPVLWGKSAWNSIKTETPSSSDYVPNPDFIHDAVSHIVTCSLILNTEKFNLRQWITKYMKKKYAELFEDTLDSDYAFASWVDFIIDYEVTSVVDYNAPGEELLPSGEYHSIVAQAMKNELSEYLGDNKYIHEYCKALDRYI